MFETIIEYPNGGIINAYLLINKEAPDYDKVKNCCDFFAKQGSTTVMTPRLHHKDPLYQIAYKNIIGTIYEGKCPDFLVDDKYYELEGFDPTQNSNPTRTFSNMISRGIKQSDRIILEDCGVTHRWARRNIQTRILNGDIITEVWILENNGSLSSLY